MPVSIFLPETFIFMELSLLVFNRPNAAPDIGAASRALLFLLYISACQHFRQMTRLNEKINEGREVWLAQKLAPKADRQAACCNTINTM